MLLVIIAGNSKFPVFLPGNGNGMSVGNVIAAGTGMYINIQIRGGGIVPPFTPLNQNIFYDNRPLISRMDVSILIFPEVILLTQTILFIMLN